MSTEEHLAPVQYSVFGASQKLCIVAIVAATGWFSTLSSFIYNPIIPILADDLGTSVDRINLTITSYLVVSGIAPSIAGDAADMFGRRPIYVITLSMYLAANVGIALQDSFAALLLLRMLQSAGISGTFSIAYGVVADIAVPSERGKFVGLLSLGITTAPTLGSLLGGALAYASGWRWIFWFLSISSGVVLLTVLLILPETARSVVGNGSVAPLKYSRPLIPAIMRPWHHETSDSSTIIGKSKGVPNPLKTLVILIRPDTAVSIMAGSIIYMVYSCSNASLATALIDTYHLNQLQAGLVYLPFGISSLASTLTSGKLMDRDYRMVAQSHGLPIDKVSGDDLRTFPIEEARMRSLLLPSLLIVGAVIGYGWTVSKNVHISGPLILQAVAGFSIQTCFNYNNTLVIDINQETPATAQAAFNLVRCALAAVGTAVLQPLIDSIGFGWTFTLLGSTCIVSTILYHTELKYGMSWRNKRYERYERYERSSPSNIVSPSTNEKNGD